MKKAMLMFSLLIMTGAGCTNVSEAPPSDSPKDTAEADSSNGPAKATVKILPAKTENLQPDTPKKDGETPQVEKKTNETKPTTPEKTDLPAMAQEVKSFTMTAKQWSFEPSTITVNKGDKIKLTIKSVDVTHGFGLTEFGIDRTLTAGKTETVEFTADKAGTFSFFCSEMCGSGHKSMKGTLIVK